MAATSPTPDYTLGEAPAQQSDTATFEYKAAATGTTGGGYPRWRSYEWRPHTARQDKEDVYVPVHRLCAVAWLFPDDMTAADILDSGELVGADVHHGLGMPAANVDPSSPNFAPDDGLEWLDHADHSSRTQAQVRAWAEDAKRDARDDGPSPSEGCERCDAETGDCGVSGDDRDLCLDCATEVAEATGGTVEL